jgi:hypothetical protein
MLIIHLTLPLPLPSREGLIYQPSPLVGEGGGEEGFIVYKQTLNKKPDDCSAFVPWE